MAEESAFANRMLREGQTVPGEHGELVLIEWFDSSAVAGWHREEPETEPLLCRSVGWLVHDGKGAKTLAASITEEEEPQRNGEMTIPTCAIKRMEVLLRGPMTTASPVQ